MEFISEQEFKKLEGFLDSKEKVRAVREALTVGTKEAFKRLDNAKLSSWEDAHRLWVK
jgi:hypothetical protein